MNPLSRKASLIRFGAVLVAMCVVAISMRGLKTTSIIGVLFFALISLKYLFFDGLAGMVWRRWSKFKVLPWLWIGYAFAAVTDIVATWMAMSDDSGASLALSATIFISPCFLIGAFVLMVIHTLVIRKQ